MSNWPVKSLGDICDFVRGVTYDKADARSEMKTGFIPLLRATNITEKGLLLEDFVFIPKNGVRTDQKLFSGDSLITIASGSASVVGRSVLVEDPDDMTFGAFCGVLRPRAEVLPRYLSHFLSSRSVRAAWSEAAQGTNINNLKRDDILQTECPVPPLEEQKRIVELLDAATARISELREIGSRHSKLETEIQIAIVERLLAPEVGWNSRPLNEWCSEIGTGPFGSLVHKADYVEKGIPLVNPMNIKEGRIVESGIKRVSSSKAIELNNYVLKTGDIVLGRRGEMGRCAVVRSEHDGWICGTGSFFLRPNENCNPDLLAIWLSSRQGRSALCSISTGTTMDNLGNKELGLLQVAFPVRPAQDDIVSRASALESLVSEMQIQQHDRSLLLESLEKSILEAAFAGDL